MVLNEKKTTVAYRCPSCGAGVMSVVGLFRINADMLKLKCDCGGSEMTVVMGNDKKVRFTVPCVLCPNPHHFTVSSSLFFDKELFILPCPYSNMTAAVMGETERVKAELARSEIELLDLIEKSGIENLDDIRKDDDGISDPEVLEIIKYMISELDEEGKISCKCELDEERKFEVELLDGAVRISCPSCSASKTIPTNSLIAAYDFLHTDSIELE